MALSDPFLLSSLYLALRESTYSCNKINVLLDRYFWLDSDKTITRQYMHKRFISFV